MDDSGGRGAGAPSRRAVVVYEKSFPAMERFAECIAKGLADSFDPHLSPVADIEPAACRDYDLVVTGSATHEYLAASIDETFPLGESLRDWLGRVPPATGEHYGAAFDVRAMPTDRPTAPPSMVAISVLHASGYAALSRQSFFVIATTGAVVPGELQRAGAWARSLAQRIAARR
jgi:hypothetical protein